MRLLFVGCNWISKWILTQCLFDDEDGELEITCVGQDTPEWFFTEVPRLKEYMGDERIEYKQVPLSELDQRDSDFDAIYITDTEPEMLNKLLSELDKKQFKGPIILASSWTVYGWKKKKRTPILETERDLNPENNEARHLRKLEEVMLRYKQLQTVILRYAEVVGPYMPESSEVINLMIDCLSSEEIDVYPPPSRNYDWVHVKFIYQLVPKLFGRKFIGGGEIYNVGSGEEKKITWLANSLRQLSNSPAPIKIHMPESAELTQPRGYHSVLNCEKAAKFLQYEPDGIRIQSFLEICRWVEKDLPPEARAKLTHAQAPNLEETYPMLKPEWGSEKLKIVDEHGQPVEIGQA